MIQEVRIKKSEINENKNFIRKIVREKYQHIFGDNITNAEVNRYNYYLYQLEQMRKAEFDRIDNAKKTVDLSSVRGFSPVEKNKKFSPLLITPNLNIELNGFTETYEQLMELPNSKEFAEEFYKQSKSLYIPEGYSKSVISNDMILQILLMNGYLTLDDLSKGMITQKVNRETLAAIKYAVVKRLNEIN
jgi:hypothetical protein